MFEPPRSAQFDDVYFSAHDGAEETKHVFLDGNNLPARWQGRDRFTIAETGFGTGLNFLLAWELFDKTASPHAFLDFISVEKYPLEARVIRDGLSPWAQRLSPYLDKMIAQYPMRVPGFHRIVFDNRVALTLIFDDVHKALPEITADVDAWFLDGFSPAKNPDMWSEDVFSNMARLSHQGTSFATFTSAGFVKRGLQAAGFEVEKIKGFARKREMLVGRYVGDKKENSFVKPEKVFIHGGGLAGGAVAYVLKQYGLNPVVYDPHGIASGASGNSVGLINPRFTAFRTPESDFYTAGFSQTVRTFSGFSDIDYARCGSLHLVTDDDKQKRFERTIENWAWQDGHMQMLSAAQATDIAGIPIKHAALYLPESAQVNVQKLCQAYLKDIEIVQEKPERAEGVHILAMGAACVDHPSFANIPIHTVRGQVTQVGATDISRNIRANICYGGYIAAARADAHVVGSTFQKWLTHTDILVQDDIDNIGKLQNTLGDMGNISVIGHRAALRVAAKDRFPVAGELDAGEYVSAAHGSHGIVSSLMTAHLLADMLRGGAQCLGKSSVNALSPRRFV